MFSTIVSGIILLIFICAIIGMNINKLIKSGLALLVFTIGFAIEPTVFADENQLQEQHIHAYIHEDGSATITEERKVYVTEGTEMFIVIGNLGKSLITNFTVEEDGETYEYLDEWDVDASLEEKWESHQR